MENEQVLLESFKNNFITIIYLREITSLFNRLTIKLQGNNVTIIETIKSIKSFRLKIVPGIESLNEEGLFDIKRSFPLTYGSIISRNISKGEVRNFKT